jgi:hypothetical protein
MKSKDSRGSNWSFRIRGKSGSRSLQNTVSLLKKNVTTPKPILEGFDNSKMKRENYKQNARKS